MLLAACGPSATPAKSSLQNTGAPTAAVPGDVTTLLGRDRFVIAHRGSGDNWPEHTLTAYRHSLEAGVDAIEISVCATADGVLICHHDTSAKRTLGVDRAIADMTWAEVANLPVDARRWLGPETPLEPVSRLEDVFDELGADFLGFIEDKQGTNTAALLDLLDRQPRSRERFIWKQWAGAGQIVAAKARGYTAWGFFDEADMDRLEEFAGTFDALGVPVGLSDDLIRQVAATGVPLIAWEVHFHDDVSRLTSLGVAGLMCSNIGYLNRATASGSDTFGTGQRAAGDLPAEFDRIGWSAQPQIVPDRASVRIERSGPTSYLMGSLAEPGARLQTVAVTARWPEAVPSVGAIGIAMALTGDAPGGEGEGGSASGYEMTIDGSGLVEIRARVEGVTGETLGSAQIAEPAAGESLSFTVALDPDLITVALSSRPGTLLSVADGRWRGPWLRLVKNYETSQAAEFSGIAVTLAR